MSRHDAAKLEAWLAPVDGMSVECDGATRITCMGTLTVDEVGRIPHHWWTELDDGTPAILRPIRYRVDRCNAAERPRCCSAKLRDLDTLDNPHWWS